MEVVDVHGRRPGQDPDLVYVGRTNRGRGWYSRGWHNSYSHLDKSNPPYRVRDLQEALLNYRREMIALLAGQTEVTITQWGRPGKVFLFRTREELFTEFGRWTEKAKLGCWCLNRLEEDINPNHYQCHAEILVKIYRQWQKGVFGHVDQKP
jgi:hypothetical protein